MSPTTRRAVVRVLFLVVAVALVAQFAYAYAVEEPFPSFVFPNFEGAPDHGGPVSFLRPVVVVRFDDAGAPARLSYQTLLDPAPSFVQDAIAYSTLAPPSANAHPRTTSALFRLFLEQPSFARGAHTASAALRAARTRVWLRGRLAELYPRRTPEAMTVVWQRHRYVVHRGATTHTVTTVVRVAVALR